MPTIQIDLERTPKGFTLWVNAEPYNWFSHRGENLADLEIYRLIKLIEGLGFRTLVTREKEVNRGIKKKTRAKAKVKA
jgi:hypothetical protein